MTNHLICGNNLHEFLYPINCKLLTCDRHSCEQNFTVGDDSWPPGCNLRYCSGDNLSNTDRAIVNALTPGQVTDVSVEMHSPSNTGVYQSQWRLSTPTGLFFGGSSLLCGHIH